MPDVLRPIFDHVVIKELEPDRMRKSGLLIPEPPNEGIVLAVGDGPPDLPDFKMPAVPGDLVVFPRSASVRHRIQERRTTRTSTRAGRVGSASERKSRAGAT